MPGCKPSFKKAAGGGKRIGGGGPMIAANQEINPENALYGGSSMPVMNKRIETAAPPAKAGAKGNRSSGGLFG